MSRILWDKVRNELDNSQSFVRKGGGKQAIMTKVSAIQKMLEVEVQKACDLIYKEALEQEVGFHEHVNGTSAARRRKQET